MHELRTYVLRERALAEYVELVREVGRPARGDAYGTLEGHWSSPFGSTDRLFTLWSFESLSERERLRASLAQNEAWTKGFLPRIADLVLEKTNTILVPLRPYVRSTAAVYELRTHRVRGPTRAFVAALEKAAPTYERTAKCMGMWATEVGNLGDIVHLWAHRSLDALSAARASLDEDFAWKDFVANTAAVVEDMRAETLLPTAAFPSR